MHPNVPRDGVYRDLPLCVVLWNSRTGLQGDQHNPQTVVLNERLGVMPRLPLGLVIELLQFPRNIEFEYGAAMVCG